MKRFLTGVLAAVLIAGATPAVAPAESSTTVPANSSAVHTGMDPSLIAVTVLASAAGFVLLANVLFNAINAQRYQTLSSQ